MPGVGKVRARQLMERIGISESRRVRGLGTNQVAALRKEFGTSSLGELGASGLGNASPS
jgi:ribosomal protein S13